MDRKSGDCFTNGRHRVGHAAAAPASPDLRCNRSRLFYCRLRNRLCDRRRSAIAGCRPCESGEILDLPGWQCMPTTVRLSFRKGEVRVRVRVVRINVNPSPQSSPLDQGERWIHINLRSEEHTSELQSRSDLVCRLLLEKKNNLF